MLAAPALAVLFDMDGLLIDSEPLWNVVTDAFCQKRGQRYTDADIAACLGHGVGHTVIHLARTYGWSIDESNPVEEILKGMIEHMPAAPAMAGAAAALDALQGLVPLGLGSSSDSRVVQAALRGRGWLERFDVVVTGSDVKRLKPAPDIYQEAARRLRVPPSRCVVLEDSLVGCTAARAAGARVIAVPAPGSDRAAFQDIAHQVVGDLPEAIALLRK